MCRLDGLTNRELDLIHSALNQAITIVRDKEIEWHTVSTAQVTPILEALRIVIFREDESKAEKEIVAWLKAAAEQST